MAPGGPAPPVQLPCCPPSGCISGWPPWVLLNDLHTGLVLGDLSRLQGLGEKEMDEGSEGVVLGWAQE